MVEVGVDLAAWRDQVRAGQLRDGLNAIIALDQVYICGNPLKRYPTEREDGPCATIARRLLGIVDD